MRKCSSMQKYSNTIEVCSIGSDQSLLFCDLCACVQETREGCIDISDECGDGFEIRKKS